MRVRVPLADAPDYLQQVWYGLERLPASAWTDLADWLQTERDTLAPDGHITWTVAARVVAVPRR